MRIVVPAIGNEFIAMIKDSSPVSIITSRSCCGGRGSSARATHARSQAFLVAALVYWVLTIIFVFRSGSSSTWRGADR